MGLSLKCSALNCEDDQAKCKSKAKAVMTDVKGLLPFLSDGYLNFFVKIISGHFTIFRSFFMTFYDF